MVARRAHNPKVVGSNPAPATKHKARKLITDRLRAFLLNTLARGGAVVARRAHNPKVVGSNPAPATKLQKGLQFITAGPFSLPVNNLCLV